MDSRNNEISTTSQIQSETENKERISAQMDVQTADSGKTVNTTAPSAESSGNSLTEKYSHLTPHQQENERIKEGILDNMTLGTNYSIADMLCTFDCFQENMTPTQLSALLSQLGPRGSQQIDRIEANGKAYFCLVKQSDSTDASDDERKLTPHQIENDAIMTGIVDNMAVGTNYTIADMLCTFDCFPETMTPQRLSALLSQLGERGSQQIDRIEANGKAFFVLNENGVQKKATITQEYKAKIKEAESKQSVYSTGAYGSGALYSPAYSSFSNGTQKTRRKTEYYTDWDGRKYYYDKTVSRSISRNGYTIRTGMDGSIISTKMGRKNTGRRGKRPWIATIMMIHWTIRAITTIIRTDQQTMAPLSATARCAAQRGNSRAAELFPYPIRMQHAPIADNG